MSILDLDSRLKHANMLASLPRKQHCVVGVEPGGAPHSPNHEKSSHCDKHELGICIYEPGIAAMNLKRTHDPAWVREMNL